MKRTLKMKCPSCGHWNRVPVDKLFVEQSSPEPKMTVIIPMYETLKISKCKKCGWIIAEPKELIRIVKSSQPVDNKNGDAMIMPSSKSDSKAKKKKRCENCGQELREDEVYELNGMSLCVDCYNEEEDLRAVEEEWIE